MAAGNDDRDGPVSVDVDIEDGRTTIAVSGTREAAVVVRSASGEGIYLPPERAADTVGPTPYRSAGGNTSPYAGIPDDSPYRGTGHPPDGVGLTETVDGFRIVHPEPVTDLRLLR